MPRRGVEFCIARNRQNYCNQLGADEKTEGQRLAAEIGYEFSSRLWKFLHSFDSDAVGGNITLPAAIHAQSRRAKGKKNPPKPGGEVT